MRMQWQLWQGAIPEDQINKIVEIGESFPPQKGTIFSDDTVENKVRTSTVRWIENLSIRNSLWEFVQDANLRAFNLDVHNFAELQFTEYHGSEGGHYGWHHDVDWQGEPLSDRKVSVTVQLSDPSEYEGGDFQFDECETPAESKAKGTVLVFPSYLRHRVLPVTKGTRKSLVAWFHGPRWR